MGRRLLPKDGHRFLITVGMTAGGQTVILEAEILRPKVSQQWLPGIMLAVTVSFLRLLLHHRRSFPSSSLSPVVQRAGEFTGIMLMIQELPSCSSTC